MILSFLKSVLARAVIEPARPYGYAVGLIWARRCHRGEADDHGLRSDRRRRRR